MVRNIMSWLETKIQLVISHMPLLARGQQSPTPEGGEYLPWSILPPEQDMALLC
jgi:hypothetical protein